MRKISTYTVKSIVAVACVTSLSACTGFFDTDNTPKPAPLVAFQQTAHPVKIWSTNAGNGSGNEFLKMSPAMDSSAIYTANIGGTVTSVNKQNGHINWQSNTGLTLTTGPGVGSGVVVIGSRHGNVMALNKDNGHVMWRRAIKGELLASPAIKNHRAIVKTIDGTVYALSTKDGKQLWTYHQTEPNLVLRGSSSPVINNNDVVVGFANGKLASSSLSSGEINWIRQIATPTGGFAIQRMIDIDADPLVRGNNIFAATYQGEIASLNKHSGRQLWSHKLSSYSGMTTDEGNLYVSDASSYLWAFKAGSGRINWKQKGLYARNLSGPASIGDYIVVGDAEGYLHWLNKSSGKFAAREYLGGSIYAKPLVSNSTLYALSSKGYLAAYKMRS